MFCLNAACDLLLTSGILASIPLFIQHPTEKPEAQHPTQHRAVVGSPQNGDKRNRPNPGLEPDHHNNSLGQRVERKRPVRDNRADRAVENIQEPDPRGFGCLNRPSYLSRFDLCGPYNLGLLQLFSPDRFLNLELLVQHLEFMTIRHLLLDQIQALGQQPQQPAPQAPGQKAERMYYQLFPHLRVAPCA